MSARPLVAFLPPLDGVEVVGGGDGWARVVGIDPAADPWMLVAVATARLGRQCQLLEVLAAPRTSMPDDDDAARLAGCMHEALQEVLNLLRAAALRRCYSEHEARAEGPRGDGATPPGEPT